MVQLTAKGFKPACNALVSFNSSMVQLTETEIWACLEESWRFQFQYGAIDGVVGMMRPLTSPSFQFQYGAIDGQRL